MKVKIDATEQQIELLKKTGSRNRSEALPALEAFATVLAPVVLVVLDKLSTVRMVYNVKPLSENDVAEFPLDVFFDEKDGDILVHVQQRPGGTPSSFLSDIQTVIVPTANYMAEVSWQNKFARAGRLDVVAAYIHKLGQAMVRKEEINGWSVLLRTLALATTNGLSHVVPSATTDGRLHLDHLNKILSRSKRINTSIDLGTAANAPQGITDLFMSIEAMEDVRAFSYNPINVKGALGAPGAGDSSIHLPADMREEIIKGAGVPSLFGINLHMLNELGSGFAYNKLFKSFYSGSFTEASQQVILGVDSSRDSNVMPVKGGVIVQNDIFHSRSDKSGVVSMEDVGWAVLDQRAVVGGIIK